MSYGWIQVMDEELVTTHLGVADKHDSYNTAKRKLGELIAWHVAVATDERVNGGYRLVKIGADIDSLLHQMAEAKRRLDAAPERGVTSRAIVREHYAQTVRRLADALLAEGYGQ